MAGPGFPFLKRRLSAMLMVCSVMAAPSGHAESSRTADHVTLTNGFEMLCDHREPAGGERVRLFADAGDSSFVEVGLNEIASVEAVELPSKPNTPQLSPEISSKPTSSAELSQAELRQLLSGAGVKHNLDVNLLASLVKTESGGHSRAVSRTGAQGLMQLMPRTAAQLGVRDSFRPTENVAGGTAYLDSLLTRYHDNLALALAAYNAGPGAVDRWHGIPPYQETRLYVARVIRDFNAAVRKTAARPGGSDDGLVVQASLVRAGTVAP